MLNHYATVSSEGSIPVEETGPEMDMTWTMFLRRGVDQVSVRLTRFEGLSLSIQALPPTQAELIVIQIIWLSRVLSSICERHLPVSYCEAQQWTKASPAK